MFSSTSSTCIPARRHPTSNWRTAAPTDSPLERDRRAADRDPARHVGGLGAVVVPRHRWRPRSRDEPIRVGRRRGRERSVLLRRRWLPTRSRTDHRPGRAVHDVPRRQQCRDRRQHRGRRGRQRIRRGHDAVAQLPDDDRSVRSHRCSAELRRRLRDQAQPSRHRTRVLDLRRWQRHGVRTRHGDRWIRQRLRHRPDEVVELPDHRWCVRPNPQHPGQLPTVRDRQHRQLRLQAQRGRLGAGVLHLPRWHRLRRGARHRRRRDPAMRTCRARRCRATSRPQRARSTGREAASTTCS